MPPARGPEPISDSTFLASLSQSLHHGFIAAAADGRIVAWSRGAEEIFGYPAGDALGRPVDVLVPPDRIDEERAVFDRVLAGERIEHHETERVTRGGVPTGLCITLGPVRDEAGSIVGVSMIAHDNGQRRRARGLRAELASMVNSSSDAIVSEDRDGIVTTWNAGAERLYGYPAGEAVGRPVSMLVPAHRSGEERRILDRALAGDLVEDHETERVRRDGSLVEVSLTVSPLRDAAGAIVGALSVVRDVTERKAFERARRAAEERYRTLFENAVAGIFEATVDGRLVAVNRALADLLGFTSPEELMARVGNVQELLPEPARRTELLAQLEAQGVVRNLEGLGRRRDGSTFRGSVELRAVRDSEGRLAGVQGVVVDVAEGTQAEEDLRRRMRTAFANAPIGMAVAQPDGRIVEVNRALCRLLGHSEEELVASTLQAITHPDDRGALLELVDRALRGERESFTVEQRWIRGGGEEVWVELSCSTMPDRGGQAGIVFLQVVDMTERKRTEEALAERALHDPLTGLPNRALLRDRLRHALGRLSRRESRAAVMFIDLDKFKVVNDRHGHEAGDTLLLTTAGRLRRVVRPGDTVARLGGDEFAVLCEDLEDERAAAVIAGRICRSVGEPVQLPAGTVLSTASVGVALTAAKIESSDMLLANADTAMYRAKSRGGDRYEIFDEEMRALAIERLGTESALRRAVEGGELRVHYQPQIDLGTGRISGVEALVRWQHPERGLLGPDEFIALAEDARIIVPLGEWVLEEACRQLARWQKSNPDSEPLVASVNVSVQELTRPDLPDRVAAVLRATGLAPAFLAIEIAESVFEDAVQSAGPTLEALKALGVRVVVDDFGSGSSSLSSLQGLEVDGLKVDRRFVGGMPGSTADTAIVTAVARLTDALNTTAIAEGAETSDQVEGLRAAGFRLAQGYYFSRPQPPEALGELLGPEAEQQG